MKQILNILGTNVWWQITNVDSALVASVRHFSFLTVVYYLLFVFNQTDICNTFSDLNIALFVL